MEAIMGVITDGKTFYQLEATVESTIGRDNFVDSYAVDIKYHFYDKDCDRQISDVGCCEATVVRIGDARKAGYGPTKLFGRWAQEYAKLFPKLFDQDTDDYRSAIHRKFDLEVSDLLIIDYIELLPAHRGKGLCRSTIMKIATHFGGLCGLVCAEPEPLQYCKARDIGGDRWHALKLGDFQFDRVTSRKIMQQHWEKMGFSRIPNSPYFGIGLVGPSLPSKATTDLKVAS
jgi:hypothetical protein